MDEMTVGRLRGLLENFGPEAPVRMAQQPPWPFEYSVADVVGVELDGPDVDVSPDDSDEVTVYLVEGEQLQYLPERTAEAVGWSR